jgi:ribosomal protein S18 acetylase RimI-like enzyme
MVTIRPITPQDAMLFKSVRLRALEDTPSAFGSTYAKESQLPDAEWLNRATNWNGESRVMFLAMDEDEPCGIAGVYIDPNDTTRAQLISMWTSPTHRQRGIGRLLVSEVLAWTRMRKVHTLQLMVTSNNETAMRFYERLGFARTGHTESYPNDPALIEYEMARVVGEAL